MVCTGGAVPARAQPAASPPPSAGPACPPAAAVPSLATSAAPAPAVVAVDEKRCGVEDFHCTALEGCPQATFGRPLERRSLLGSAGSVLIMDDGGREELQLPTIQSYLPLHKSPQAPGLGKLLSKGTVGLGQEAERLTAALGVD